MSRKTHNNRTWFAAVVLLAVFALIATACTGDTATTTVAGGTTGTTTQGTAATTAPTTAPPAEGRSLIIALPEEPRHLASWNAYSNDGHPVLRNVGEALLNRDPVSNELVPELALSYEQIDDNTWQFTLREGVMFHDGSPFNAEAAAFSINYVLSEENNFPMRQFMGSQITVEAVDEYTIDVSTVDPDPILPLRLYFVTIPSAQAIQDSPETYETTPIGTGPYKFDEWNQGQYVDISANEDWWGLRDTDEAFGTNQLVSNVRFIFREESAVRAALLDTDEADFARFITPEQCEAAPQCKGVPTVETVILRLDIVNPTLADMRIRRAIALAVDKDAIMNGIMGGGEIANQIVSSSALGWNPDVEPYPYDLEQARALVEEAAADGVDVTAPLVVAARTGFILRADETIQLIQEALNEIGLTGVTSQMMETAAFEEQWQMGSWENVALDRGLIGMNQHGNELMDYAASMGYYTCAGTVSVLCDQEVEALVTDAIQKSGDERDLALQAVAAHLAELYYIVPVGYPIFYFGLVDGVNWTPRMDGFILIKEFTFS